MKSFKSFILKASLFITPFTNFSFANENVNTALHNVIEEAQRSNKKLNFEHIRTIYVKDIDAKDKYGKTPLHLAVIYKNKDLMKFLIELGADVNARDINGRTPLHEASKRGITPETVKILVENGAEVNAKTKYGETALHYAIAKKTFGKKDVIDFLIENGANVNARDINGETPLHYAFEIPLYILDKLQPLVESGAEVNAKNNKGQTVLDLAILYDVKDVIDFLQRKKSEGVRENILKKTLDKCRGIFKI